MTTDSMQIGTGQSPVIDEFVRLLNEMDNPTVLELGTKRWLEDFVTHHRHWLTVPGEYLMSDIDSGTDVDLVMDAHEMTIGDGSISALVAVAVWEHLARPWIAAREVARVLRSGGIALVETHQTFPLHGYPDDRWRFTIESLSMIFEDAGMEVLDCRYQYPCKIVPSQEITRWNPGAEAFLNVAVLVQAP